MCSLVVHLLMRSLPAIRQPQTPSFTKSPSTCGGKCLVGFLSHSRICSLRSFARARIARVDIIYTIRNPPNYHSIRIEIRGGLARQNGPAFNVASRQGRGLVPTGGFG